MLTLSNLEVFYGDAQALWDVSMEVRKGEIVTLLGSNGAGKSTTLKTISGLLRPRKGEIRSDHPRVDSGEFPPGHIIRSGAGGLGCSQALGGHLGEILTRRC